MTTPREGLHQQGIISVDNRCMTPDMPLQQMTVLQPCSLHHALSRQLVDQLFTWPFFRKCACLLSGNNIQLMTLLSSRKIFRQPRVDSIGI